jgi:ABC-type transporter Mla MlaB component
MLFALALMLLSASPLRLLIPLAVVGNLGICWKSNISLPAKPFLASNLKLELQVPFSPPIAALVARTYKREKMLRITRAANEEVVFTVSGRLDAENLAELKTLFTSEVSGLRIGLDLKELTQVDQAAVSFLMRCESNDIQLKNCPAYIREWITRERRQS